MVAEMAQIRDPADRWRFATGSLRIAVLPPARHPRRVLAVAIAGLVATAAATAAAVSQVPTLSVFVPALALLLCGYATVATSRSRPPRLTGSYAAVVAVAVAGVAASVTSVVWIAAVHPAATNDPWHAFSVLLALTLAVYLAVALLPARGGHQRTALCWALAGTLTCGAINTAAALAPGPTPSLIGCALVTLAVGYGGTAATRSKLAGARAGLLTAALCALTNFAVITALLAAAHHYSLTSAYDIAQFHHSGAPDVASYVISDGLGGGILDGLLIYPVIMTATALAGCAAASNGFRRVRAR
jgi:hypothetical protein